MALYELYTKQDLIDFRDLVNSGNYTESAILMADIDLEGNETDQWIPIDEFSGIFDGNGFAINGIYIDKTNEVDDTSVGFISMLSDPGQVKNLNVNGSIKSNASHLGGIIGYITYTTKPIFNCTNSINIENTVKTNTKSTGGIIGASSSAIINNCVNYGNIINGNGIHGECPEGTTSNCVNYGDIVNGCGITYKNMVINNCINEGNITGTTDCEIAGISYIIVSMVASMGNCINKGNITVTSGEIAGCFYQNIGNPFNLINCVNTGNITVTNGGTTSVAGIFSFGTNGEIFTNCTNTGNIKVDGGTGSVGGVVGWICTPGTINNCVNTGNITGTAVEKGSILGRLNDDPSPESVATFLNNCFYLDTSCNGKAIGYLYPAGEAEGYADNIPGHTISFTEGNAPAVSCLIPIMETEELSITPTIYPYYNEDISTVKICHLSVISVTNATVNDNNIVFKKNGNIMVNYSASFALVDEDDSNLGNIKIKNKSILKYGALPEEPEEPEDDTYKIYNIDDLIAFRNLVNAGNYNESATLMNDIDLEGDIDNQWIPIADKNLFDNTYEGYTGIFDGNSYIISGIYIDRPENNTSFIGLLGAEGVVKNISLNGYISGGNKYIAGIVSECHGGTVLNCISNIEIIGDSDCDTIGGIVGILTDNGEIYNCINKNDVHSNNNSGIKIGGICGNSTNSIISGCLNSGQISGKSQIAGICPDYSFSDMINCVNLGRIIGTSYIAGITNSISDNNTIRNCYNQGFIKGDNNVSGIINDANDCIVTSCVNESYIKCKTKEYWGAIISKCQTDNLINISNNYYRRFRQMVAVTTYSNGQFENIQEIENKIIQTKELPPVATIILEFKKIISFNNTSWDPSYNFQSFPDYNSSHQVIFSNKTASNSHFFTMESDYHDNFNTVFSKFYPAFPGSTIFNTDISYYGTDEQKVDLGTVHIKDACLYATKEENMFFPFDIYTVGDLLLLKETIENENLEWDNWDHDNAYRARLMNNIDLEGSDINQWVPIDGNIIGDIDFYGNGYTIKGLYINKPTAQCIQIGLFMTANYICDLTVEGNFILGDTSYLCGGILGAGGTAVNCVNKINITAGIGSFLIGGISGGSTNALNCINEGNIYINGMGHYIGGILGAESDNNYTGYANGIPSNCINRGNITVNSNDSSAVGGIIGYYMGRTKGISNNINSGDISGGNNVSGILGLSIYSSYLENNINTGDIAGITGVGGITGNINNNSIYNGHTYKTYNGYAYYCNNVNTGNIKGVTYTGGIIGHSSSTGYYIFKNNINNGIIRGTTHTGGIAGILSNIIAKSESNSLTSCNHNLLLLNNHCNNSCTYAIGSVSEIGEYPYITRHDIISLPIEEELDIFEISTAEELKTFAYLTNAGYNNISATLMNDIDLEGDIDNQWIPIVDYDIFPYFTELGYGGIFDGNDFTITGMYIDKNNSSIVNINKTGFIGSLTHTGTVKNLNIEGSITAKDNAGGIVGEVYGGNVINCNSKVDITAETNVGGIIGLKDDLIFLYIDKDNIITSINEGNINGVSYIGGIVGRVKASDSSNSISVPLPKFINCINKGNIYSSGDPTYHDETYVYGIANSGHLTNCINEGNITGNHNISGLADNRYSTNGVCDSCINRGDITGVSELTGICNGGNIVNCINEGNITGTGDNISGISNHSIICEGCTNTGDITGVSNIGGILVGMYPIINCINNGSIIGTGSNVGGICSSSIIGTYSDTVSIINNTNNGDVTGVNNVGGILGNHSENNNYGVNLKNNTNNGVITGETSIGGISGSINYTSSIIDNINNGEIAGVDNISGVIGYLECADTDIHQTVTYNVNNALIIGETNTGGIIGNINLIDDMVLEDLVFSYEIPMINNYYLDSSCDYAIGNLELSNCPLCLIPYSDGLLPEFITSYDIYTAEELNHFAMLCNLGDVNISAKLMNDIDLEGDIDNQWIPIKTFSETFDGNNYTIKGLYIEVQEDDDNTIDMGFISYLFNGTVKNLTLEGNIIGPDHGIGGVAAKCYSGKIYNCVNKISITPGEYIDDVGGIVGYIDYEIAGKSEIINCINLGNIILPEEGDSVGGIVGSVNYTCDIINCINKGNINGESGRNIGGILGNSTGSNEITNITNCMNEGNNSMTYEHNIGGIVGASNYTNIINCINKGDIGVTLSIEDEYEASTMAGIVAYSENTNIINCINEGNITGRYNISGICGEFFNDDYYADEYAISNCVNTGNIIGIEYVSGILCDYNSYYGTSFINNCVNTENIIGDEYVSGICTSFTIGYTYDMLPLIENCVNDGLITSNIDSEYHGAILTEFEPYNELDNITLSEYLSFIQNNYYLDTSCDNAVSLYVYDENEDAIYMPITNSEGVTNNYIDGNAPAVACLIPFMEKTGVSIAPIIYPYYNEDISTVTISNLTISDTNVATIDNGVINFVSNGCIAINYNVSFELND